MNPWWRKIGVRYWSHPKVIEAGWKAGIVFSAILDLNAELDRDGALLARDVRVEAILGCCSILGPRAVKTGLKDCLRVGLLSKTQEGGLRVVNWSDYWRVRSGGDDQETTDGMVRCSRCGTLHGDPDFRRCPDCRSQDRARWNRRGLRTDSAELRSHSAGTPQETPQNSAATPQPLRRDSAEQNGYRSGMLLSEDERREDQSRQELMDGWMDGSGSFSRDLKTQKASVGEVERARNEAGTVDIRPVLDTLAAQFRPSSGRVQATNRTRNQP